MFCVVDRSNACLLYDDDKEEGMIFESSADAIAAAKLAAKAAPGVSFYVCKAVARVEASVREPEVTALA